MLIDQVYPVLGLQSKSIVNTSPGSTLMYFSSIGGLVDAANVPDIALNRNRAINSVAIIFTNLIFSPPTSFLKSYKKNVLYNVYMVDFLF